MLERPKVVGMFLNFHSQLYFVGHRACQCHFLILARCPRVMSSFEASPSVEADRTQKSKQAFIGLWANKFVELIADQGF